ncbi:MAG: alpha/beta fold hydrolase [Bdellovibrionales bacterium]|nr:alpha/beta fold hydrolase [Bdellovibrionales bacterium]
MPKMVPLFTHLSLALSLIAISLGCAHPAQAASPEAKSAETPPPPAEKKEGDFKQFVEDMVQTMLYPTGFANQYAEPAGHVSQAGCLGEFLNPSEGVKVEAWICGPEFDGRIETDKPILLYFHGNGENIYSTYRDKYLRKLARLFKVNVAVFDYPGYGYSEGPANQLTYTASGVATVNWLQEIWKRQGGESRPELIMMGYSLGTGVAMQTLGQTMDKVDKLILIAPWSSFAATVSANTFIIPEILARSLVPEHLYDSLAVAKKVEIPVLVVHGDQDRLIPNKDGERLFKAFASKDKTFRLISSEHPGASVHRHTMFAIQKFLKEGK